MNFHEKIVWINMSDSRGRVGKELSRLMWRPQLGLDSIKHESNVWRHNLEPLKVPSSNTTGCDAMIETRRWTPGSHGQNRIIWPPLWKLILTGKPRWRCLYHHLITNTRILIKRTGHTNELLREHTTGFRETNGRANTLFWACYTCRWRNFQLILLP